MNITMNLITLLETGQINRMDLLKKNVCAPSPVITDVFTSPPQLMDNFLKGNLVCLSSDHRAVG